jgi:hypothetical protein
LIELYGKRAALFKGVDVRAELAMHAGLAEERIFSV